MVAPLHQVHFSAMASACTLCLDAPDGATARRLAQLAIDEVARIQAKYSRYISDSVVGRINAAAGRGWTECDAETGSLLDYAAALHAASGGLFDITSGVLQQCWDFRRARIPDAATLARARRLVGWQLVQREPGRVRLARAGMQLDFGGYGKEYAADRAAAILIAHGVRHGYVNLGGDLRVLGPQPDGSAWMIGIQHPRDPHGVSARIPLLAGALATSGDYERYFEQGGRRYCHLLDPRSGQPVSQWRSVSVLAPLAVGAGSLATIAMLKQQDALAFLRSMGVGYLAIDRHGRRFHQLPDVPA